MPPDPPHPRRERNPGPAKPAQTTVVGGLPWEVAPPTPASPAELPAPTQRLEPPPEAQGWLADILGPEEAAEFAAIPARIRARLDEWVRRSPPFTVSLCLHVVVLLVLALIFVRIDRKQRRPIDLSFASTSVVEAEKPGVQIVEPQPEPEPEPEPEVMEEEKVVEDPIAAPVIAEAEKVEALGAEPEPAGAPAVGALLDGREEGRRERLVAAYGGSDATEAAVGRALDWLVRQQGEDGLWSLQGPYVDGASQENRLAATAMSLLAFQGAGNTPRAGRHKRAVAKAWKALLQKQVAGADGGGDAERRKSGVGRFEISLQDPPARQALYAHAQVTIALCELYGMTKDPAYEQPARRAVAYAVAAQGNNGGWRYDPGQDGDMSVTGWYMMALKSAEMAGLDVPERTLAALHRFLDEVAVDDGSRYGYRFERLAIAVDTADRRIGRNEAFPVTAALSAEGLLCRQYLGWPRAHPGLAAGMDVLLDEKFLDWDEDKDVYAWYYITQVAHHLGGAAWERWNGRMKELLPAVQVAKGNEQGSWDPSGDNWKSGGGRLFTTCFCTYMLEVYYRHLPLYGEDAVAGAP